MSPSILILRLSSLGDIVLTTPLIASLREKYPEGRIELVIAKEYESLVPLLPGVSEVHIFDKRSGFAELLEFRKKLIDRHYDHVLDLHDVLRTKILRQGFGKRVSVVNKRTFKRWLLVKFKYDLLKDEPDVIGRYFETASGLGIRDDGRGPTLIATASKRALKGAATKSGFRDPKHIAIAPGARHWNKRWPAEHYRELAIKLIERGYNITFYGSKSEIELIDHIRAGLPAKGHHSLAGELDLAETAHLIGTCGVAITNDSGLLHVAEAVGTPVISMFGPTVRQFGFAPRAANAIVLEVGGLYCRPCTAIGLGYCPEKHFRCMREIGAEVVMEKILYPVRST